MNYLTDTTLSLTEAYQRIKGEAYMECLIVLVVALIIYLVIRRLKK